MFKAQVPLEDLTKYNLLPFFVTTWFYKDFLNYLGD